MSTLLVKQLFSLPFSGPTNAFGCSILAVKLIAPLHQVNVGWWNASHLKHGGSESYSSDQSHSFIHSRYPNSNVSSLLHHLNRLRRTRVLLIPLHFLPVLALLDRFVIPLHCHRQPVYDPVEGPRSSDHGDDDADGNELRENVV